MTPLVCALEVYEARGEQADVLGKEVAKEAEARLWHDKAERCESEVPRTGRWLFAQILKPFELDLLENPYGPPRPTESQNPPATKKEIPTTPKTPIFPKSKRSFPKSKR